MTETSCPLLLLSQLRDRDLLSLSPSLLPGQGEEVFLGLEEAPLVLRLLLAGDGGSPPTPEGLREGRKGGSCILRWSNSRCGGTVVSVAINKKI